VVKLAMNCHDIWARRKRDDLDSVGAELHDFLVPYDLLTDQERTKDLEFANELIKFLQLTGYRMQL
jgi:ryanodine receptor 2